MIECNVYTATPEELQEIMLKSSEALVDIPIISEALVAIMEHECCIYGFNDAYKLAKKWQREAEDGNS